MGALGNGTFGRDPLYEASKNCVRVMLEGMMSSLRSQGIQLTIVSPGRIAVRLIVRFLEDTYDRGKADVFGDPYLVYLLTALVRAIPAPVFEVVSGWLGK